MVFISINLSISTYYLNILPSNYLLVYLFVIFNLQIFFHLLLCCLKMLEIMNSNLEFHLIFYCFCYFCYFCYSSLNLILTLLTYFMLAFLSMDHYFVALLSFFEGLLVLVLGMEMEMSSFIVIVIAEFTYVIISVALKAT